MTKKIKRYSGRIASTAGLLTVLGVLLYVLLAYAAVTVGTYQSNYTTVKNLFGRGIDTVYAKMAAGIAANTYYAEYWGPAVDDGTDMVFKARSASLTSDASGVATSSYFPPVGVSQGAWEARFLHNPLYTEPTQFVIDSPAVGSLTAGVATTVQFHLVDRDGNIITASMGASLYVTLVDNGATVWNRVNPKTNKGWAFSGGYYTKDYTPATDGALISFRVYPKLWAGTAAESGDAYALGNTQVIQYWRVGTSGDSFPYALKAPYGQNQHFVSTSGVLSLTYYFDVYDKAGSPMTSVTGASWVATAKEASDYNTSGAQNTYNGTTPQYDGTAGHWYTTFTLSDQGKYKVNVQCSATNTPYNNDVINVAGAWQFQMAGDVTPPANVTGYNGTPSDNRMSLGWTNPGDSDFAGVLILRNTVSITDTPLQNQLYTTDGAGGPNTIGTSRVVYVSNGTSFADGDPCVPPSRLTNGTTYYYKAFSYDNYKNYASGSQVSGTPSDVTATGPATGVSVVAGDQQNTINWTNPSECDFAGATIRYKTNGSFPTARDGSDGSALAGDKVGGTPGGGDSFTHTSLTNGTPYYYTIWAKDDEAATNWSAGASPAAYGVPHDVTKPGMITDLTVNPGSINAFDVTLEWTSPADDNYAGTNASQYDVRYYDQPITGPTAWNNAWHAVGQTPSSPRSPGSAESYLLAGLAPMTQYYFAIKTADEVPNWSNWSGISITPEATTACNSGINACNQCHLMPPDDDLPGAHPRGTGNIGAHYLPIHAGSGTSPEQCNVCHMNGDVWRNNTTLYEYTHQNDVIDINDPGKIGNLAERQASTGGTFYMSTTIVYKYKNYSSGIGYKQMTGTCTNTYCHGAGLSSPKWGLEAIVCGEYCHETPPATGRHVKHYHPGQYYINFAPDGTLVSGYSNDDGATGWSGSASVTDKGSNPASGGNRDARYATFISSSNSTKTFTLPDGTWYITVCVGDSSGAATGQKVQISGNGGDAGGTWTTLINQDTSSQKLFKKVVDEQFFVLNGKDLQVRIGDGSAQTKLNFMIINGTPEAPKANTTVLANTPSEYGFACGKCHVMDLTQSKHTSHVNGAVQEGVRDAENAFDGNSFPKNPYGSYTQVAMYPISSFLDGQGFRYTNNRSCINTYCHGTTLNAGGSATDPRWHDGYIDVQGASLCGSCHDAAYADTTPNTNITTGSHKIHTNKVWAYRLDCYKCHYHTVGPKDGGGEIAITDKTHHVNGDVDASFDVNDNTMKFGRYSTSVKTCYQVYCHSNGLLKNNQPYWATTYTEPVWDSGEKTCNYCHGTSRSDGMPDYANMTSTPNSHKKHVDDNNQNCSKCHYQTTRDGFTITTTIQPSLNVNGVADVTFDPENSAGTWSSSNLECGNTYCHGLTAPPTWGGVVECGSCHGVSPTNPNPGIGAHNKHSNGNHTSIGVAAANKSTAALYDFTCEFCHYSRAHGGGKFRPYTQVAETNFNTVGTPNGYNNSGATYVTGNTISTDPNNWEYTDGKCRDTQCHSDGLGGLPNNTSFTWTSGALSCSDCHNGRATAPAGKKMATDSHAKHVWESLYRFTCGDCHAATATADNLTNRANHDNDAVEVQPSTAWGGSYNDTDKTCNSVKCHWNGDPGAWKGQVWYVQMNWTSAVGTTCTGCHSDNHVVGGDTAFGGAARAEDQTLSFNHKEHLDPTASGGYGARFGCANCHNATATSNTTLRDWNGRWQTAHNNQQKISDIVYSVSFFNMTGNNSLLNYTAQVTPATGYWGSYNTPIPGNCTVICHSDGKGGNPIRFPNWSTPEGAYGCAACHAADASSFALPNYTANSFAHVTHLNNGVSCNVCHRLTASSNTMINASGFTVHHVNGTVADDVKLAVGTAGSYVTATKTCSGLSCHGDRAWTTHYASNCYSCHDSPARYAQHFGHYSAVALGNLTGVKSNSNANKSTAANYMFGCGKCHDATQINHNQGNVTANQAAEVEFDGAVDPKNALGKYTTLGVLFGMDGRGKNYSKGSCRSTYCHSDGQASYKSVFVSWTTKGASITCTSCHGGGAAYVNMTGVLSSAHARHVGTDYYQYGCIKCHNQTVSSDTAVNDKAKHVNGVRDVYFDAANPTGSYAAVTCSSLYCHGDGNGGTGSIAWNAAALNCRSCHGGDKTSAPTMSSGMHTAHINNADPELATQLCTACHVKTVGGNTAVDNYGYHVDGAKNVNFTTMTVNNYTGFYVSGGNTCRNVYCHSSGQARTGTAPNYSTPVFRVAPSWISGGALTCNGCHGQGNSYGSPDYTNRSTASKAFFNGHQKHVLSSADCVKCHMSTTDSSGTNIVDFHLNGSREVDIQGGGSYDTVTKRCSGTTCHGAAPLRWGGKLPNDCQSCHSDQGAGTYGNHSTNGKHKKHTDSATYKLACEVCHAALNASGNATHLGGDMSAKRAAEVVFHTATTAWRTKTYGAGGTAFRYREMDAALGLSGITPTYQPWTTAAILSDNVNTNRKYTQGRCGNIWCHSDGQDPITYATYANWSTAETANCRGCHAGDKTASPTMSSGKHTQHVNNGDLASYRCASCHVKTVATNGTIDGYGYHVNGTRDANFTTVTVNNYTGSYVTAGNTCRNTYCHSSGQATSAADSTPVFRIAPSWLSGGALTCNGCHGLGNSYGAPDYANVSTVSRALFNGHGNHVSSASDCIKCHRTVVNVFGSLTTGTVKHIDGARDVSFRQGGSYNATNKSCSSTDSGSCHGATSLRWGGTASCADCHQVTGAETDDFTYNNGTRANINFYEYTSVGHGKKGAYRYSNKAGANKACTDCHSPSVPHGKATNPFRLISSNVVMPRSPNTLCLQGGCHSTSPSNHDFANVNGSVSSWNFTPKCVDCHDPHGDSGGNDTDQRNYQMIQSFVNYTAGSDAYGAPTAANMLRKAVDFPNENPRPGSKTRLSYVDSTSFDGICQVCHERGSDVVSSTTHAAYFNRGQYDEASHNAGQPCMGCHGHGGGFKGAGGECAACHGTGGAGTAAGRTDMQLEFGKKSHHVKGAAWPIPAKVCAKCHGEANADGSMSGMHQSGKAVVLRVWSAAFTNLTGTTAVGSTFVRYSTGNGTGNTLSSNQTIPSTHCASCHNAANAASTPFNVMNVGDTGTPSSYDTASGGTGAGDVNARYSASNTANFSKYSPQTYNVVPQIVKAYSPHGNATNNQRGVATTLAWADDGGNKNVGCVDCHNSHGSNAGSPFGITTDIAMSGYSSAVSGWYGGILKQTAVYTPTAGGTRQYGAGADLCFDCHLGDQSSPKTYTDFGNGAAIKGYYDPGRWQDGDTWTPSFSYKTAGSGNGSGTQKGGHFGASTPLSAALRSNNGDVKVKGRCTKCHDPHGVNPGKGNAAYMLPALKNTWMASPYKEDRVGAINGTAVDPNTSSPSSSQYVKYAARLAPRFDYNNPALVGAGYGKGISGQGFGYGSSGYDGYFIDDNTFGTNMTYGSGGAVVDGGTSGDKFLTNNTTAKRITETTAQFAGLCLDCHNGAAAQQGIRGIADTVASPTIHVHRTVKGWDGDYAAADIFTTAMVKQHWMDHATGGNGRACSSSTGFSQAPGGYRWSVNYTRQAASGGLQPQMHKFPCSKCHAAHTSKLPRLMKTNCLDVGSATTVKHNAAYTSTFNTNPIACNATRVTNALPLVCHNYQKNNTTTNRGWNSKTGW